MHMDAKDNSESEADEDINLEAPLPPCVTIFEMSMLTSPHAHCMTQL